MNEGNQTIVKYFFLLGLGNLHNLNILFFILFLIIYIAILMSNIAVVLLVVTNHSLYSPMYFFLCNMSLSEILFTTNIVPNMLRLILLGGGSMSVTGCLTQFYLLGVPTIAQCLLLATMSFDRYLAICKPLRYTSIMNIKLQLQLGIICWLLGVILALFIYIFLNKLEFCDSSVINHFYCDIAPVIELSCSDTLILNVVTYLVSVTVVISPFMFIIVTYICIFLTILRIPSATGKQKAFSTCSSHLAVVCTYYGTLTTIYIFPSNEHSGNINRGLALLYTMGTPLFNPIIYSLRNQGMRRAIQKTVSNLGKI
ncbi:olfactory receptor 11A1-like [Discoglossus pictus]